MSISKSYHRTDIEDIPSIFDQFRHMVSNLECNLQEKLLTPKNIGEALKDPLKQLCKKIYQCNTTRIKISALFRIPYWSNVSLIEKRSSVNSLLQLLRKETVMMNGILLHSTVKMRSLISKVLILIITTVQWHILTPSDSKFLSRLCIDSLPVFWMSDMYSVIKILPFMKQCVSVHHPIILTDQKNLTLTLL